MKVANIIFSLAQLCSSTIEMHQKNRNVNGLYLHYALHGTWSVSSTNITGCNQDFIDQQHIEYNTFFKQRGCCPDIGMEFIPHRNHVHPPLSDESIESFKGLLNIMRNKTVMMAGDSVLQQTFHAFQLLLKYLLIDFRSSSSYYQYSGQDFELMQNSVCYIDHYSLMAVCGDDREPCECSIVFSIHLPKYNFTVLHLFFYTLTIRDSYITKENQFDSFNNVKYLLFEHIVSLSDAVVVNVGVHYDTQPAYLYAQMVRYIRDVLIADMERNEKPSDLMSSGLEHLEANDGTDVSKIQAVEYSKGNGRNKRHAFLLTLPTHFRGAAYTEREGGNFNREESCVLEGDKHFTNSFASGIIEDSLYTLDFSPMLRSRGDLHSVISGPINRDCVHWCFWFELFFLEWEFLLHFLADS